MYDISQLEPKQSLAGSRKITSKKKKTTSSPESLNGRAIITINTLSEKKKKKNKKHSGRTYFGGFPRNVCRFVNYHSRRLIKIFCPLINIFCRLSEEITIILAMNKEIPASRFRLTLIIYRCLTNNYNLVITC